MAFNPTSPVTGALITGLTSPTYTLASDQPPFPNAKQYIVSALGGTQTGVSAHMADNPFTVTAIKPANYRSIGVPNPITGVISQVPKNVHRLMVRKGVLPAANQKVQVASIDVLQSIPAGAESSDPLGLAALYSVTIGMLTQARQDIYDSMRTNSV